MTAVKFDPCCNGPSDPSLRFSFNPVTVPSTLFEVYRYLFVGSSTMQVGPDPTEYGLFDPPIDDSLPVESRLKAVIELFVCVAFAFDWFSTYTNLLFRASVNVHTGFRAVLPS